jgi:mono/diheme cytochrome c family protein
VPCKAIILFVIVPVLMSWAGASAADEEAVARGKYVFDAAGCAACHTDSANKGALLAGGRQLKTPFGNFYSPNITPDPEHGIGRWTEDDFLRALREGVAPDGSNYFPVFPYPSYTRMTDADIRDLRAYILTLPPDPHPNREHEVRWPYGWRFLITFWKWLFFEPGPMAPDPVTDAELNRGAYLVLAMGHCGECHTPRNAFGALESDMTLAGTSTGPGGGAIPNITPDPQTGIGDWSADDLDTLLSLGMAPDGDFVGSEMGEVVENTTSRLTATDRKAMITFLKALPPIHHEVARQNGD